MLKILPNEWFARVPLTCSIRTSNVNICGSTISFDFGHVICMTLVEFKVTSHMRLSVRDQYNSSTLIGGKGGAGPSSLHTILEGPMEYVNVARWM
jgi:hypothetical protein